MPLRELTTDDFLALGRLALKRTRRAEFPELVSGTWRAKLEYVDGIHQNFEADLDSLTELMLEVVEDEGKYIAVLTYYWPSKGFRHIEGDLPEGARKPNNPIAKLYLDVVKAYDERNKALELRKGTQEEKWAENAIRINQIEFEGLHRLLTENDRPHSI